MAVNETPRSIRFPDSLWKAIDEDAKKHLRSSVKHMEYLFSRYYGLIEEETSQERFYRAVDTGIKNAIPAVEISDDPAKKRAKVIARIVPGEKEQIRKRFAEELKESQPKKRKAR